MDERAGEREQGAGQVAQPDTSGPLDAAQAPTEEATRTAGPEAAPAWTAELAEQFAQAVHDYAGRYTAAGEDPPRPAGIQLQPPGQASTAEPEHAPPPAESEHAAAPEESEHAPLPQPIPIPTGSGRRPAIDPERLSPEAKIRVGLRSKTNARL